MALSPAARFLARRQAWMCRETSSRDDSWPLASNPEPTLELELPERRPRIASTALPVAACKSSEELAAAALRQPNFAVTQRAFA